MHEIQALIKKAAHIVIIQADNPDGDSLASSLALEYLLADQGKKVSLYCGVDIPTYLRYMNGWDRVVKELPKHFDLSIIVDTTALSLLETLQQSRELAWLKTRPVVVIDHHMGEATIDFATASLHKEAVSTGELIYELATICEWKIESEIANLLASSILSDSLGLTSEAVTAKSIRMLADLVDNGADLAAIDNLRKSMSKKSAEILTYKGRLLERVEYAAGGRVALVHIPWEEIETYSHQYNPSILVIDEMRMVENVQLAIALKTYPDGKITAKIRANYGTRVANRLAEHFGGGGHPYAAGFKVTDGRTYANIKSACITVASKLLDIIDKEKSDETVQHTN